MTANREACEVQGAYAGEEVTKYTGSNGDEIKTFNRFYADGEYTIFEVNSKVRLVKKTSEIPDEQRFINENVNLLLGNVIDVFYKNRTA